LLQPPPPSDELCEILLDPTSNQYARIGIGRCHFEFFREELDKLLQAERNGNHPDKGTRIARLEAGIAALPRSL